MKTVGIIAARGGSKRLPRKNIRDLAGKPLIAWTIAEALKATKLHRVICSTEDPEIAAVARRYGCDVPFMRPDELALDNIKIIEPVLHAIQWLENNGESYETVVTMQCTSPLRRAQHIDAALSKFEALGMKCAMAVCETHVSPFWSYTVSGSGELVPIFGLEKATSQTQKLEKAYMPNGSLFINDVKTLKAYRDFLKPAVYAFIMDQLSSVDIDSEEDFQYAEYLLERNKAKLL